MTQTDTYEDAVEVATDFALTQVESLLFDDYNFDGESYAQVDDEDFWGYDEDYTI